jgi:predicted amidohydrolase YtcJ
MLSLAGARVIKVESETRPDGAREGPPAFFDLLHAGQECVALDFRTTGGRANLRRLLTRADVVIEASRPRALSQLGVGADDVLASGRPRVWVSITGFGHTGAGARRVAFGDDAAVAGGLVAWDEAGPCFCAAAIAGPAAGLLAAAAVVTALGRGGRWLLDVALSGVAAFLAGPWATKPFDGRTRASLPFARPRSRTPTGRAAPLGEHTSMAGGWLRGVRYHESVAGPLDRDVLDLSVRDVPVRIQHRSGALWIVNSMGLRPLGVDQAGPPGVERDPNGRPTGRLFGLDDWLRDRVATVCPDLRRVGTELLGYGITGVTDATPTQRTEDAELLAGAVAEGVLPQRVQLTGGLWLDPAAGSRLARGPVKLVVADHDLPPLAELAAAISCAHSLGRPVAIHAVSHVGLVLALAAWQEAGVASGDRVEHGAVVAGEQATELARLGIAVITQPVFVTDRGDQYLTDVDPEDLPHLWPYRSLLDTGVSVAPSSDAPFGDPDPWRGIAAAVTRRTLAGRSPGGREAVDALTCLNGYLTHLHAPGGPPRRVRQGAEADLVLLRLPLPEVLTEPSAALVALTIRAGIVVPMRAP